MFRLLFTAPACLRLCSPWTLRFAKGGSTIENKFAAASAGPPSPSESLTKNLRDGDLGEFGKCGNRAVARRILKA